MPGISVPWDPARLAPPSPAPFHGFSGEVSPTVLGPRVVLLCVLFPPPCFLRRLSSGIGISARAVPVLPDGLQV